MRFSKLFILTLLVTGHFHSASAMEKENELKDIIGNIRTIKVADRSDITYDGRIGHGAGYRELNFYKQASAAFPLPKMHGQQVQNPVKDYFVYSEEEAQSYKHKRSPRLYDLCFTRWERNKPEPDVKKGLIVLWNILPSSSLKTTSKDPRKQLYARMRQESYTKSFKNLLTYLKKDNDLYYYYEIFPSDMRKILDDNYINRMWGNTIQWIKTS